MPLVEIESAGLRLEALPEAGASIVTLAARMGDAWVPILRPTPPEAIATRDSSAMASFVLAPYSNRIRDARFEFRGRTYQLRPTTADGHAIHGDVRKRPWHVVAHGPRRLAFAIDSRGFADANFPFTFTARLDLVLGDDALTASLALRNVDGEPMPAGIGFHPYFRRWLLEPEEATALRMSAPRVFGGLIPSSAPLPVGPEADFGATRPLPSGGFDHCFAGWDGRATIEWPASRLRAEIEASPTLDHVILYTPEGRPFFALEPVSNANDGFNLLARGVPDSGVRVLEPGQTLQGSFRLRIGS